MRREQEFGGEAKHVAAPGPSARTPSADPFRDGLGWGQLTPAAGVNSTGHG